MQYTAENKVKIDTDSIIFWSVRFPKTNWFQCYLNISESLSLKQMKKRKQTKSQWARKMQNNYPEKDIEAYLVHAFPEY